MVRVVGRKKQPCRILFSFGLPWCVCKCYALCIYICMVYACSRCHAKCGFGPTLIIVAHASDEVAWLLHMPEWEVFFSNRGVTWPTAMAHAYGLTVPPHKTAPWTFLHCFLTTSPRSSDSLSIISGGGPYRIPGCGFGGGKASPRVLQTKEK
jgi:hypothetical protein